GTIVRPGETNGCVGCHEQRRSTPAFDRGTAWQHGPLQLKPWYGRPRLFGYTVEVQPVFDKHCVSCHDYGKDEGKKLNLAGDLGLVFNTSYAELRGKGYVSVVGAGPFTVQMPKTWGSHASRLAKVMLEGHGDPKIDDKIKLGREDIDRVITWIDINAPYYPSYAAGAYVDYPYGRSPLDKKQLERLGKLTSLQLVDARDANVNNTATVNFTRPESSTCLEHFTDKNDPKYKEALLLIRAGSERLQRNPRPDMPGFRLVHPVEIQRENKYQQRLREEADRRAKIVAGQ
ncbi:MAG: hypothetical protein JXM70_13830, partial [Pirellulales bacterium]|nr:hypothetical protein [Pirellulales bacterium]